MGGARLRLLRCRVVVMMVVLLRAGVCCSMWVVRQRVGPPPTQRPLTICPPPTDTTMPPRSAMLGWVHRERGVALDDLTLSALLPSSGREGVAVVYEFVLWLHQERSISPQTEGLVVSGSGSCSVLLLLLLLLLLHQPTHPAPPLLPPPRSPPAPSSPLPPCSLLPTTAHPPTCLPARLPRCAPPPPLPSSCTTASRG